MCRWMLGLVLFNCLIFGWVCFCVVIISDVLFCIWSVFLVCCGELGCCVFILVLIVLWCLI